MTLQIVPFNDQSHRDQVISLWTAVFGYEAEHNAPELVIDRKLAFGDGLFFVALDPPTVVGTIMAGYDGHRGWIYSVAVSPEYRRQGVGSGMLNFVEDILAGRGCVKINLQITAGNEAVVGFYLSNGYATEKRISMGKPIPRGLRKKSNE